MFKRLTVLIVFFFCSIVSKSQRVYYIYLQTEGKQPFYVKREVTLYSSSATGYLILSKLIDSTYSFTVGFPGNKWPEQHFTVKINKSDHGFLLKNFGDKGWGLFDLKTLNVQMSGLQEAKPDTPKGTVNEGASSFADILSKASDDPTLKERPGQQSTLKKIDTNALKQNAEVIKPDSVVSNTSTGSKIEKYFFQDTIKSSEKESSVAGKVSVEEYRRTTVKKKSESSTTQGFGLVFTDEKNGVTDTIRLLIPNPQGLSVTIREDSQAEEKKFLDVTNTDTTVKVTEQSKNPVAVSVKEVAVVVKKDGNCSSVADDNDFFKLRKMMAAAEGDEAMTDEAKKYLKTKCFSVQQIRNLSLLYLADEGKYRFFDMAYPYISDIGNFSSLQTELKDEYYINRLRAMLRN
jgi:hypothetical protein